MANLSRRVIMILGLAIAVPGIAAAADDAGAFVDTLGHQTMAALDRVGADPEARRQAISGLLDKAVDLPRIARLCLGRHWRTIADTQRAEYVTLFRANVLEVLSRRMSYYTGAEKFVITATRPAGDGACGADAAAVLCSTRWPSDADTWSQVLARAAARLRSSSSRPPIPPRAITSSNSDR